MAVFPFTVRATDSEGSFSDRQFNITVRNTRVERYLAIDETDAWTSPDGQIWTRRPGAGGRICTYGDQGWLVIGATFIRKSLDGINWSFIPLSSTTVTDTATQAVSTFPGVTISNRLRFFLGRYMMAAMEGSTTFFYSSADGISWTKTPLPSTSTGVNTIGVTPTIMEDNGDLFVSSVQTATVAPFAARYGWMSSNGGITWNPVSNVALTSLPAAQTAHSSCALYRVNGLWLALRSRPNGASVEQYAYGTDGSNWTQANLPTGTPPNAANFSSISPDQVLYANGVLYVFAIRTGTLNAMPYFTSTDGVNWQINFIKSWGGSQNTTNKYIYRNGVFLASSNIANGTDDSTTVANGSAGLRLSTDGINWQTVNRHSSTAAFNDIAAM